MTYDEDPDLDEIAEHRAADRARRRYDARLWASPDPRDPDHPGRREDDEAED